MGLAKVPTFLIQPFNGNLAAVVYSSHWSGREKGDQSCVLGELGRGDLRSATWRQEIGGAARDGGRWVHVWIRAVARNNGHEFVFIWKQ